MQPLRTCSTAQRSPRLRAVRSPGALARAARRAGGALLAALCGMLCFASSSPVAAEKPQRTWPYLTTGNGHGFQFYDTARNKITHFLEHPYRYLAPRPGDPKSDGLGRRQLAYDFYFGIRGGGGDECLGILTAPADAPTVSQAKETGQAAATINTKNLSNMWAHLPARSKARAVWLINNDVEPELDHLTLPAGTGALEPRFVTYGPDGALRIKGRPVMQLEQCATLGTVGDIILADLGEYILSPQGGIDQQSSMHVRFIYNEMTFRWNYYINGRPAWLSALTPYKGTTKLSPFVTLATRA